MKLSSREKKLIIILLITVVGYVVYTFVPMDNLFNLGEIKEEYNSKKLEYDSMSQNILMKQAFEAKAEELSDDINNFNMLSDVRQENVMVFLNKYFSNNNIDDINISFTDAEIVTVDTSQVMEQSKSKSTLEAMMNGINTGKIEQIDNMEANEEENQDEQKDGFTIKAMIVDIAFECTYENLLKFIDAIQNHQYDITITSINTVTDADETGNKLQGSMVLNFYEVPKLDSFTEKNSDWTW